MQHNMETITFFNGEKYIHSEYTTALKLNKLPNEVKDIILELREKDNTKVVIDDSAEAN